MSKSFIEQHSRQLGFLERSCASYDAGFVDEAMRIATAIRVLFHETRTSVPLLKHLDALEIDLVTTVPDMDAKFANMSGYQTCVFRGLGSMRLAPGKAVEFVPKLDQSGERRFVKPPVWWNQIVWVLDPNTVHTRKSIVLTAANKDGGAHVEPPHVWRTPS